MKQLFKFQNYAFHIIFWIVVAIIFTQYSFLRPCCRDTHLYKEILCALMIAMGVYLNKFIVFSKLYLRGKYLQFWSINTILILSLGFIEFQLIKPDINFFKNLILTEDFYWYLLTVFILVTLRDAAFFAFFFIIRVNQNMKYLLRERQQLLAIENKQIIVTLSAQKEIIVNLMDIVYISSDRNCISFHLINNRILKQYQTLAHLEEFLPKHLYVRINRSNIVFYRYVCEFDENYVTIRINDKYEKIKIPIQQSNKAEKYDELKKHISSEILKMNGEIKKVKKEKIRRNKKDDSVEINEISKQILETIRQQPSIFASEIKKKLNHFSERNIDRYLKKLKNLGLVVYKGARKNGGYYPV